MVLSLLLTLKHYIGNLDAVKRVVKLTGFLNCVDGYTEQPRVMDGASEGIWTPQRCS